MKTILLLGGFGFIGSNILHHIDTHLSEKYKVIVFDKIPAHFRGLKFKCIENVYAGDFSDSCRISRIFKENEIDVVFHFLSSTVPSTSMDARYDVESNLLPSLHLFECMKEHGVKEILYLSSGGAIYGDAPRIHNEEDAVYPKSSYGIVKLAIEKYMLTYAHMYNVRALILRLSNPYGTYHYSNKQGVCNIAVRKALHGETLQVWGTGEGIKDYIYIDDVTDIIFRLLHSDANTDVVNVSSSDALSVNKIYETIQKIFPNFKKEHIQATSTDVQNFRLDNSRLLNIIGPYHFTSFKQGLQKTIDWEKLNLQDI